MRRLPLLLVTLLAACSRGSSPSVASAASARLAGALAQSGVQCQPHQPLPVLACDGKSAGVICHVIGDDGTRTGTCKAIPDGRLVCAGAHEDGGASGERGDRQHDGGGDFDGDGGHHDDGGVGEDGGRHDHADAGEHHDGGDFDDDGGHHDAADGGEAEDGGDDLLRPAVDACANLAVDAPCSFTFEEHPFSGACEKTPAGKLICAPICGN